MRFLKRTIFGLLALVVLLVAVGFVLPRHVHVERSIVIAAPQGQLFDTLNGFRRFNEFSPWAALDPGTQYAYEGPETGVGARMRWSSSDERVGSGSNGIVESTAPDLIRTKLDFGDQGTADAAFRLEAMEESTRVTWSFDTDLGNNPMARYFGLMFDRWIGDDYETGLARLKELMEQGNAG